MTNERAIPTYDDAFAERLALAAYLDRPPISRAARPVPWTNSIRHDWVAWASRMVALLSTPEESPDGRCVVCGIELADDAAAIAHLNEALDAERLGASVASLHKLGFDVVSAER